MSISVVSQKYVFSEFSHQWDSWGSRSKPGSSTWSNSLITGNYPAARARKHVLMFPSYKTKLCIFQNSMIFPWVTDPKFKDFSMIFFHFYKFQELFMKCNDFSVILKQIWISMIFQELLEPWLLAHCAQWCFTSNGAWHFTKLTGADTLKN